MNGRESKETDRLMAHEFIFDHFAKFASSLRNHEKKNNLNIIKILNNLYYFPFINKDGRVGLAAFDGASIHYY